MAAKRFKKNSRWCPLLIFAGQYLEVQHIFADYNVQHFLYSVQCPALVIQCSMSSNFHTSYHVNVRHYLDSVHSPALFRQCAMSRTSSKPYSVQFRKETHPIPTVPVQFQSTHFSTYSLHWNTRSLGTRCFWHNFSPHNWTANGIFDSNPYYIGYRYLTLLDRFG